MEKEPLPAFLDILNGVNEKEQAIVSRIIWTLSFDIGVSRKITCWQHWPELNERLQSLKKSQDPEVVENVSGALCVLNKGDIVSTSKSFQVIDFFFQNTQVEYMER